MVGINRHLALANRFLSRGTQTRIIANWQLFGLLKRGFAPDLEGDSEVCLLVRNGSAFQLLVF
jgi:hypothetical protein